MTRMQVKTLDVVGVGNALVDVLAHVEDGFLSEHGVMKGIMHLIDHERASMLYGLLSEKTEVSGGSAANTVAGVAMLGGSAGFIGKVCADPFGSVFAADLARLGVKFATPRAPEASEFETGRSTVMISPDGERTMNTYLGAAEFLSSSDIDPEVICSARWIFLEGFRLDGSDSVEAFRKAVTLCHDAVGSVALTLSDPFCVERNRNAFGELINGGVELLLCNREELTSMYEVDDVESALELAAGEVPIVACTMSENGAIIAEGKKRFRVGAYPADVVDVTGAGDLFAAGFLHALVSGADLESAGQMGCAAASEVISHVGARPQRDLRAYFRELGLGQD